jgi:Rv2525c-like, glycoside hydrolase-like domain
MEAEAFAEISAEAPFSPKTTAPPTFAGLDAGSYPGQQAMDAYREMGFVVTGLYLTHAPARAVSHKVDAQWIAAAPYLAKTGWGIAPIYVGAEPQGSSKVPPPINPLSDAQTDAAEAVTLAQRAGFQAGQTIFLDVEAAFPANSPFESYVLKWLEQVQAAGYRTALYCFPAQRNWCAAQEIPIWTVHLNSHSGKKDPHTGVITWSYLTSPLAADPIDAGAIGTQGRFYCRAAQLTIELDYDRWTVADPSRL